MTSAHDWLRELGLVAFGSRMRRISEALVADVVTVYDRLGVNFNPKWFPLVTLLREKGPLGVVETAAALGLTHPAVSQFARELSQANLLVTLPDPGDERRRLLALSPQGLALCQELDPLWQAVRTAVASLQADAGVDLIDAIDRLEAARAKATMTDRTLRAYRDTLIADLEISDLRPSEFPAFRDLNLAWIREFFKVEAVDQEILSDPKGAILDRGGIILAARRADRVLGVCALLKTDRQTFELSKMAVDAHFRGLGFGRLLLDAAIARARAAGARSIILETSSRLPEAIALYERAGFVRRPRPADAEYARTDTWMVLELA